MPRLPGLAPGFPCTMLAWECVFIRSFFLCAIELMGDLLTMNYRSIDWLIERQIRHGTNRRFGVPSLWRTSMARSSRRIRGGGLGRKPWVRFTLLNHYGSTDTPPRSLDLALLRGMLTVDPQHRFTLADISAHGWCMRWVGCYPLFFLLSSSFFPSFTPSLSFPVFLSLLSISGSYFLLFPSFIRPFELRGHPGSFLVLSVLAPLSCPIVPFLSLLSSSCSPAPFLDVHSLNELRITRARMCSW